MNEPKKGTEPQRTRVVGNKGANAITGHPATPGNLGPTEKMKPVEGLQRRGRGDGGVKGGHGPSQFKSSGSAQSGGNVPPGTKTWPDL